MNKIQIHGKDYVMVKDRIIFFNESCPNGSITTESKVTDNSFIFKAVVIPDVENPNRKFTGHAEEIIGSSQINKTSALENCETSAIGRALGCMGIGVEESFASADEVNNAVYQQGGGITKAHAEKVVAAQNPPETAGGIVCPNCKGGMTDNRDIDGGAKLSGKGQKMMDEKKPLEGPGLKLPIYKCSDDNCKGVIWEDNKPKDDGGSKRQADLELADVEVPF